MYLSVRQGGVVLSPFLYLVYINDLINTLERNSPNIDVFSVTATVPHWQTTYRSFPLYEYEYVTENDDKN